MLKYQVVRYLRSNCFRLFFGRIEETTNCFRDLLTFKRSPDNKVLIWYSPIPYEVKQNISDISLLPNVSSTFTSSEKINKFQYCYFQGCWVRRGSVKFMYFKKATENDEIFTVDLMLCSKCQIVGEDFINFCGLLRKHERLEIWILYFN